MKQKSKIISGRDILTRTLTTSIIMNLMDIVAATSIWVPVEKVSSRPVFPNVKRGRAKDKGRILNGLRIDDNTYANRAIKEAISNSIRFEDFEVCHIWPKTTYDERYHTLLQNLVMIPRALAGLTDHLDDVINMLKYRAWELYNWYPEDQGVPQKPNYYPTLWSVEVSDVITPSEGEDVIPKEDYFDKLAYNGDKDAKEIDKVRRKVRKWNNAPNQICSIILNLFMNLSDNGKNGVTREQLKDYAEKKGVKDFMGNYNQMKNYGFKNHAKVFSEDENKIVRLWEPVSDFIIKIYSKKV